MKNKLLIMGCTATLFATLYNLMTWGLYKDPYYLYAGIITCFLLIVLLIVLSGLVADLLRLTSVLLYFYNRRKKMCAVSSYIQHNNPELVRLKLTEEEIQGARDMDAAYRLLFSIPTSQLKEESEYLFKTFGNIK